MAAIGNRILGCEIFRTVNSMQNTFRSTLLVFAAISIAILASGCRLRSSHKSQILLNQTFPEFSLPSAIDSGSQIRLNANQHGIKIVLFWTTWCPPCNVEIRNISELYQSLSAQKVRVIALTLEEPSSILSANIKNRKLPFEVAAQATPLFEQLKLPGFPLAFILDSSNTVRCSFSGPARGSELQACVDSIQ